MKILRDTREKEGRWSFGEHEMVEQKLESGDYTLIGLEDKLCIERKKSVSEIAINIGSDSARFNRELARMRDIPLSYLICEFSLNDILSFPLNSDIPKEKRHLVRISGKYILKVLDSYLEKYGVTVIYAGSREAAIEKSLEIMGYALDLYGE